jgi:hypothetical protein
LKDRIPLRFWDTDAMHQAFDELLKDKVPELRHLPWPEALARLDDSLPDLERKWPELSPLARVLLAKLRAVDEDTRFLDRLARPGDHQGGHRRDPHQPTAVALAVVSEVLKGPSMSSSR